VIRRAARSELALALTIILGIAPAASAQELPTVTPESVGMSSERLQRLTSALDQYVDDGKLPGAVAMVLSDGKVVYAEAVGTRDREVGDAMATDAIFRIASQTKALVSVGIMMLMEEGSLLLSDPVSAHLPSFTQTTVAGASADHHPRPAHAHRRHRVRRRPRRRPLGGGRNHRMVLRAP
jgi:CubicO group peptidase (beta-lactamase class C family)